MILAVETSTQVCSIALRTREGTISEKRIAGRGVHSAHAPRMIQELLQAEQARIDDLQAVLFSHGPGSYTGLRIGASLLKGLLFGKSIPLHTASTLLSIASAVLWNNTERTEQPITEQPNSSIHSTTPRTVYGLIDARRSHLYCQVCELRSGSINPKTNPTVQSLEALSRTIQPGNWVAGTGISRLKLPKGVFRLDAEAISANHLLRLWDLPNRDSLFTLQDIGLFEPEYVTMMQIEPAQQKEA